MTQGEPDLKVLKYWKFKDTVGDVTVEGNMLHNKRDFKSELWDKYI